VNSFGFVTARKDGMGKGIEIGEGKWKEANAEAELNSID